MNVGQHSITLCLAKSLRLIALLGELESFRLEEHTESLLSHGSLHSLPSGGSIGEHRLSPHSSKSRPHTFPSETQTASPCCCWMLSFKLPNQPSLAEFTLIVAVGMWTTTTKKGQHQFPEHSSLQQPFTLFLFIPHLKRGLPNSEGCVLFKHKILLAECK